MTEEEKTAFQTLGHDVAQVEGVDAEVEPVIEPEQQEPVEDVVPEAQVETEEEVSEQTEEDGNTRTWQSKYGKERHEKEQAIQGKKDLEAKNEALLAMLQGSVSPQEQPATASENKKPDLFSFINRDEYYANDALDPSTVSGVAYEKYQDAVQDWKSEKSMQTFEARQAQKQQESSARTQATFLAEKHSEFRHPITNEPNMPKIMKFIDKISQNNDPSLWAELYEFTQLRNKQQPKQDLSAIGRKANQTATVASQSASEKTTKAQSNNVGAYVKTFGSDFEYPADAEI